MASVNAAVRGRPATIQDVADVVAHFCSEEMQPVVFCNNAYYHDEKLVRAIINGSARPRMLASAIRATAPPERVMWLLHLHKPESLNTPMQDGHTILQRCVAESKATIVRSLVTCDGVQVPQDLFPVAASDVLSKRTFSMFDAAAEACLEAIASSSVCDPSTISAGGRSNLSLAAEAGLVDVVRRWLQDERCTAELLQRQDDDGHTAFTRVCDALIKSPKLTNEVLGVMKRLVYCAKLLAWDSRNSPAWTGPRDNTQLGYAAAVRLGDVLRPWIKDTRTTAALMQSLFRYVPHRHRPAAPPHEYSLMELVSGERSPLVGQDIVTPLSQDQLRTLGLNDAVACISIMASHPECSPAFLSRDDQPRRRVCPTWSWRVRWGRRTW